MGNSQGKEARGSRAGGSSSVATRRESQSTHSDQTLRPSLSSSSRQRRTSRPDFSFLGIGGSNDQDASSLEVRRENKQEREAKRAEKERIARLKERERSMKEEHIDGGYLVTQGVYVGAEDFGKPIVRQLMIERRLAPFWRGLNDFSEAWAEHQLMAAARGLPIPPADEVPPELEYHLTKNSATDVKDQSLKTSTIPIGGRSPSFQSDRSARLTPAASSLPISHPSSPLPSTSPSTPLFRTRAKTLASLTTSSKNSQDNMTPREFQLPADPFVNGQPVEVYLYKDANECPICFLYYPPYLNTTRCCEQPICSECFVQIKRPDPHPPEHEQPDPNAPPLSEAEREAQAEGLLVSEVATCPYCKQPEFGITYTPPPFRRGLTYNNGSQPYQVMSAMSSQTSISSSGMSPGPARRRGTSLSASAPEVITTDKIRPDWASKLATARAHAARRSAAATALHTAAYLMNGQPDSRPFGPFGRRTMLRRPTLEGAEPGSNAHLNALAMLAERQSNRQQETNSGEMRGAAFLPPPRGSSSRRSRIDDLEDMMMMEAIRLSLASEEERRKKEEKEAKKKAKKEGKDKKKDEKTAWKSGLLPTNSNASNSDLQSSPMETSQSNVSSLADDDVTPGKGKSIARPIETGSEAASLKIEEQTPRPSYFPDTLFSGTSQESLASSIPVPTGAEPIRRSHLRQMSNASSAASSFIEPAASGSFPGSTTPPAGSLEPLFNFQSLAAMIDEQEKRENTAHVETAPGHSKSGMVKEDSEASKSLLSQVSSTSGPISNSDTPSPLQPSLQQSSTLGVKVDEHPQHT